MANIFPLEAKMSAVDFDMSVDRAATNATSDEKGRIVAAKNAEAKRANSEMRYSL